jgi:hypothetical protein
VLDRKNYQTDKNNNIFVSLRDLRFMVCALPNAVLGRTWAWTALYPLFFGYKGL